MTNDFNLQKFLTENKMTRNSILLSENSLRQDIEDFIDNIKSDNYQRSRDSDPDYEKAEPTVEFFLDLHPKYKGKEDEIRQFLKEDFDDEDELDDIDYNTDWSKTKLISTEEGPEGTWCFFLDPEDETAEEDGFSIAVEKDDIEEVANGTKNYVLDGDNHATNMSKEEAQYILSQLRK